MSVTYLPLKRWNKHWRLDGENIHCRHCWAIQRITDLGPFHHGPYCTASLDTSLYPVDELTQHLERKIRMGLFYPGEGAENGVP